MENKNIPPVERPDHLLNNEISNFKHYHYPDLYQNILTYSRIEGEPKEFRSFAEVVFFEALKFYFSKEKIDFIYDKISVSEDYFYDMSSEILRFTSLNEKNGRVEIINSSHKITGPEFMMFEYSPLDYLFSGYIAAAFSLINDKPVGSYRVERIASALEKKGKSEYRIFLKQQM